MTIAATSSSADWLIRLREMIVQTRFKDRVALYHDTAGVDLPEEAKEFFFFASVEDFSKNEEITSPIDIAKQFKDVRPCCFLDHNEQSWQRLGIGDFHGLKSSPGFFLFITDNARLTGPGNAREDSLIDFHNFAMGMMDDIAGTQPTPVSPLNGFSEAYLSSIEVALFPQRSELTEGVNDDYWVAAFNLAHDIEQGATAAA